MEWVIKKLHDVLGFQLAFLSFPFSTSLLQEGMSVAGRVCLRASCENRHSCTDGNSILPFTPPPATRLQLHLGQAHEADTHISKAALPLPRRDNSRQHCLLPFSSSLGLGTERRCIMPLRLSCIPPPPFCILFSSDPTTTDTFSPALLLALFKTFSGSAVGRNLLFACFICPPCSLFDRIAVYARI